jgi:metallopeptidase MepB
MFYTVFKGDLINAKEGRQYKRIILEKGKSQDKIIILKDFLSKKVRTNAFYQEIGLKAKSK